MKFVSRPLIICVTVASVSASLVSCGMLGRSAQASIDKLKLELSGEEEAAKPTGTLASLAGNVANARVGELTAEEDIIWAPTDPEESVEELESLWAQGVKDDWYQSYAEAMRESRSKGKPLFAWFTNSKSSPSCKLLNAELFSTAAFNSWANENVIRLRIDSNIVESDINLRTRKREYVDALKKRYKVIGSPVVLMISPRGTVSEKYTGYRGGDPEFYFGKLKSGLRNAQRDYGKWRESLEEKGYRMWHDNRGRSLFAKLVGYSNGTLYLLQPDGTKSKTREKRLSAEDRQWIESEKEKRRSNAR